MKYFVASRYDDNLTDYMGLGKTMKFFEMMMIHSLLGETHEDVLRRRNVGRKVDQSIQFLQQVIFRLSCSSTHTSTLSLHFSLHEPHKKWTGLRSHPKSDNSQVFEYLKVYTIPYNVFEILERSELVYV